MEIEAIILDIMNELKKIKLKASIENTYRKK